MKKLLERIVGPLGPARSLSPGPGDHSLATWRRGHVPTDQRGAHRVFWIFFGAIVAINVVLFLTILIVRTVL